MTIATALGAPLPWLRARSLPAAGAGAVAALVMLAWGLLAPSGAVAKAIASGATDEQIIDRLFLAALSRRPTHGERDRLLAILADASAGKDEPKAKESSKPLPPATGDKVAPPPPPPVKEKGEGKPQPTALPLPLQE